MFDKELATVVKQLAQRHLPGRAVEDILLFDLHPRQGTLFLTQLIMLFLEGFFFGKQCGALL